MELKPAFWLVSCGFRKINPMVFSVFAHHHQLQAGQGAVFVGERADFVSLIPKLTEEPLQGIGRANQGIQVRGQRTSKSLLASKRSTNI